MRTYGLTHTRSQLILVADVPTDGFETLAAPHTALLSVKAEAPRLNLFSLPRIVVEVKPSPGGGGGLGDAPARVEFRLVRGGDKDAFHSFGGALDKTRERAVNRSRANPEDEFDLRECPLFCHTSEGARVFRWFRFFRCVCGCSGVWWPGTKLFFLDDDVRHGGRPVRRAPRLRALNVGPGRWTCGVRPWDARTTTVYYYHTLSEDRASPVSFVLTSTTPIGMPSTGFSLTSHVVDRHHTVRARAVHRK